MDGEHAKNMALKATYVAVRLTAYHPLSGDHFNTSRLRCFAVLNGDFVSAFCGYGVGGSYCDTSHVRCQHSMTLTAKPPLAVSLYLVFISAPVSRIVLMTLSRLT